MKFQHRKTAYLTLKTGKAITVFIIGGIVVHALIMFIDYFLVTEPIYLNLRNNFADSIFSAFMIPMIGTYGLALLSIYFLWNKKKKALLLAHKKEGQIEKVEVVFKSMQRLTALLAEHIATHNGEIINQVERRKKQGRPVSEKVEKASLKIAHALKALSQISFVFPYSNYRPEHVEDIEKILQSKLAEVTAYQQTKEMLY
jgi:hypothetical protein